MIWFSADWHLGHEGILTHQCVRMDTFGSVAAMDAWFIESTNACVHRNDTLFFLGDFAWKSSLYGHYRSRLNVRNFHVVRGNHDSSSLAKHCGLFDKMMHKKFRPSWAGKHPIKIQMTHNPILSWDGLHHGGIHLYGHCHGIYEDELDRIHPGRRSMDVGIDNVYKLTDQWRPINLVEVTERLGFGVPEERVAGPFEEMNEED